MTNLYNMLFGQNHQAAVLLDMLGLSIQDVGRFRDAFISDGKIAIYTRNGGSNRACRCAHDPDSGTERCKHETFKKVIAETAFVSADEAKEYPETTNILTWDGHVEVYTGRNIEAVFHRCLEPNSESCGCFGCIINYRLPKHPNYLFDQDDRFDSTYATIYFSFPDEFAGMLKEADEAQEFDPDSRWLGMLESLKELDMEVDPGE